MVTTDSCGSRLNKLPFAWVFPPSMTSVTSAFLQSSGQHVGDLLISKKHLQGSAVCVVGRHKPLLIICLSLRRHLGSPAQRALHAQGTCCGPLVQFSSSRSYCA